MWLSAGDLREPLFPGIGAGVGWGARQIPPVRCVGTGMEPEAVWCSLIEYRPQSVPCGQARMGKEGRGVAPRPMSRPPT